MKTTQILRLYLLTVASLITATPDAANAVLVTHTSGTPAPNLPGFISYTFTVNLSPGESLTSFDATFTADVMSQVNPSGQPTIWEDNNHLFPVGSLTPADDSQFEFMTSEWGLIISQAEFMGPPPPPGTLSGSASVGFLPAKTSTFDLAHVVVSQTSPTLTWTVNTRVNGMLNFASGVIAVPEASQVLIGSIAMIGVVGMYAVSRRFRFRAATS